MYHRKTISYRGGGGGGSRLPALEISDPKPIAKVSPRQAVYRQNKVGTHALFHFEAISSSVAVVGNTNYHLFLDHYHDVDNDVRQIIETMYGYIWVLYPYIVAHLGQTSKEADRVYIPHTLYNMHIFQDIKVKPVQYGYFPGNGNMTLVPCPQPHTS